MVVLTAIPNILLFHNILSDCHKSDEIYYVLNAFRLDLTGKYRCLQGNPCNENRHPAMRTGVPCNESRFFPVVIDSQGVPCELYRVWVYSVVLERTLVSDQIGALDVNNFFFKNFCKILCKEQKYCFLKSKFHQPQILPKVQLESS